MVMNADQLRATGTGDWLAQLKKILQLGPEDQRDYGNNPKAEHRSTKKAVKVLLSNLRKGTSKTPDVDTTDDDKQKVVFLAIHQLIEDKVNKSTSTPRKTKLEALTKFEDVLKQEFAAKAGKKDAVGDNWQKTMLKAVKDLRVEELDAQLSNKNQQDLEDILDPKNNHPPELRERSVKKMLASDDGKKQVEGKSHVSIWALEVVKDPAMFADLLTSLNPTALNTTQWKSFVQGMGNSKNDAISTAMLTISKKTLPTDGTRDKAANRQANSFEEMTKSLDPARYTQLATAMLNSDEGKKALKSNRKLGGALLSAIDPNALKDFDFAEFGPAKNDILAEAMTMLSVKEPVRDDADGKPPKTLDPKLFKLLATKIDPTVWNDKSATTPARKGLGARVGMELWNAGGYEQICEMIKHGVDTSLPTRLVGGENEKKEGVYSGFVEPTQHILSKYLRSVGRLEANDPTLQGEAKTKAEGAKKIFAALEAKEKQDKKNNVETSVKTLTKWSDLKDWTKTFEKTPGTIWGFEHVRMPYVQAGHESKKGSRPLRMWELWDALGVDQKAYGDLLQDPPGYTKKKVEEAAQTIADKKSTRIDYDDIKDLNKFVEEFKKQATKVLLEFAAQLPKGTFADSASASGFEEGKFLGALACKAGLWWAKEEKEPVYYCLDGINMADVTNYKKLKSTAIDDFLSGQSKKKHDEVITMVEVREILKNWDDLKFINKKGQEEDVVKFVLKGKILSGEDLKNKVKQWKDEMDEANEDNPTPAPDYKKAFTTQLNKIDTTLLTQLGKVTDAEKANRDAREIVKKYGYFVKLANTKPHIALKYIMYKCDTLVDYGLISKNLPQAATALKDAFDKKDDQEIKTAASDLRKAIKNCHKDFQSPLESALLRHPETGAKLA